MLVHELMLQRAGDMGEENQVKQEWQLDLM